MKNTFLFFALATILMILSCDKDDPIPNNPIQTFDNGVFISFEGGFGQGNAVVYFLDQQRGEYVPEIFRTVNQKPIGDILQSIHFDDDKAYLVVNNSGKIIEVNQKTFEETGTIEGLNAPTEIDIENGKGYIGSQYSDHVLVADMGSLTITDTLYVGESSYLLKEEDGRLWILSQSEYQGRVKNQIYYIDLASQTLDSVAVGPNPLQWAFGDDDELFVYCSGIENGDAPAIYTINTESQTVENNTQLNVEGGNFGRITYDDFSDRLLVQMPDGIYEYKPAQGLGTTAIIPLHEIQYLYAMNVDPENGRIYLGDARDFASSGAVYIFTGDGQPFGSIPQAGIGPNHFYFE